MGTAYATVLDQTDSRQTCGQSVGIRELPSYRSSNIGSLHSAATRAPTSLDVPRRRRRRTAPPWYIGSTQYKCGLHRALHRILCWPTDDMPVLIALLSRAVMSCDVLILQLLALSTLY